MRFGREFLLNDLKLVSKFVNFVSRYEEDITMGVGRYNVNAKSLMGILSLDLSNYVTVFVEAKSAIKSTRILDEIGEMINEANNQN